MLGASGRACFWSFGVVLRSSETFLAPSLTGAREELGDRRVLDYVQMEAAPSAAAVTLVFWWRGSGAEAHPPDCSVETVEVEEHDLQSHVRRSPSPKAAGRGQGIFRRRHLAW